MEQAPIITTKHWQVFLASDDQTYLGRCMVVGKEQCLSLSELSDEQWLDFASVVKKLEAAVKQAFGAVLCNWTCMMNAAYQADQPKPFVHWHLRPRYNQAVAFAGETFEDTAFGHHYERRTNRQVSDIVAKEIIRAIKNRLE